MDFLIYIYIHTIPPPHKISFLAEFKGFEVRIFLLTKVKKPSLPYLYQEGELLDSYLSQEYKRYEEIQTVSFRNRTWAAVSSSNDDNHYTTRPSIGLAVLNWSPAARELFCRGLKVDLGVMPMQMVWCHIQNTHLGSGRKSLTSLPRCS